jgi:anti-sigma factor RsiW
VADFLIDYLTGELSADSLRNFEHHLSICEACRVYLADYQAAVELGRRAFEDEDESAEAAGVPEDLMKAILAARGR